MMRREIITRNNGVEIHAIEFNGEVSGIPVVIIPGAINSAEEVEADLQGSLGLHHIIISLRGRGNSGSPEKGYTLADQASDIRSVLDHLELQQCAIFGHSLGSTIGIEAAGEIPERIGGFILGDFPPFYPPYDERWVDRVLQWEELQITSAALHGIAADAAYTDLSEKLRSLPCPILLIKGGKPDSSFPMEQTGYLQKIVPNVEVAVLPDSGHDIFRPGPGPLVEWIEAFVGKIEGEKDGAV